MEGQGESSGRALQGWLHPDLAGGTGVRSISEPETPAPVSHWLRAALKGHQLPGIPSLCRCVQGMSRSLKAVLQRELQEQKSEARAEGSGGLHSNCKRDWRASGQGTGCVAASHKEKPESIIKSPKCA